MKQLGTSILSATTTKQQQNETKTSANRHLTLLYMRHVTFMLIVEIQNDDKNRTNESKIPYATHYVFDVCFHRSSQPPLPLPLPFLRNEKKGAGGNCMLRYENHFIALYSHDMQAKQKGKMLNKKKIAIVEMKCVA